MGSRDEQYSGGLGFKFQILFYTTRSIHFSVWQHPSVAKERDSLILLRASQSICVCAGNPFDIKVLRENFQSVD
jgi:hypothetical protein